MATHVIRISDEAKQGLEKLRWVLGPHLGKVPPLTRVVDLLVFAELERLGAVKRSKVDKVTGDE